MRWACKLLSGLGKANSFIADIDLPDAIRKCADDIKLAIQKGDGRAAFQNVRRFRFQTFELLARQIVDEDGIGSRTVSVKPLRVGIDDNVLETPTDRLPIIDQPFRDEVSLRIENLDPFVMRIRDINAIAFRIDSYRRRFVELSVARTLRAPGREDRSIRVELNDPRPPLIHDVDQIVGRNRNVARTVEARRRSSPFRDEPSIGGKLLDAMVTGIGDVNVTFAVRRKTIRFPELTRPAASRSEHAQEGARRRKSLDAAVVGVGHENSGTIGGDAAREIELTAGATLPALEHCDCWNLKKGSLDPRGIGPLQLLCRRRWHFVNNESGILIRLIFPDLGEIRRIQLFVRSPDEFPATHAFIDGHV